MAGGWGGFSPSRLPRGEQPRRAAGGICDLVQRGLLAQLVVMATYSYGRQGEVGLLPLLLEKTVRVNELAVVLA
ncbi:hypothetical protein D3C77_282590 [compost metagenome]